MNISSYYDVKSTLQRVMYRNIIMRVLLFSYFGSLDLTFPENTHVPSSWYCDSDDAETTLMNLIEKIRLIGVIKVH